MKVDSLIGALLMIIGAVNSSYTTLSRLCLRKAVNKAEHATSACQRRYMKKGIGYV